MIILLKLREEQREDLLSLQNFQTGLEIKSCIEGIEKDYLILFENDYEVFYFDPNFKKRIVCCIDVELDNHKVLKRLKREGQISNDSKIQSELPIGTLEILNLVDLNLIDFMRKISKYDLVKPAIERTEIFIKRIVRQSKLPETLKSELVDLSSINKFKTELMKEQSLEAFILVSLLKQKEIKRSRVREKGLTTCLLDRISNEDTEAILKCPGLLPNIVWPLS